MPRFNLPIEKFIWNISRYTFPLMFFHHFFVQLFLMWH